MRAHSFLEVFLVGMGGAATLGVGGGGREVGADLGTETAVGAAVNGTYGISPPSEGVGGERGAEDRIPMMVFVVMAGVCMPAGVARRGGRVDEGRVSVAGRRVAALPPACIVARLVVDPMVIGTSSRSFVIVTVRARAWSTLPESESESESDS